MSDRVQPRRDEAASEQGGSPTTERTRTLSDEDVARLWAVFKAGGAAHCPRDQKLLALAVDAASKSYRLVCTDCGNSSQWFETSPTGIHVRNADETLAPGPLDE